ncbi:hypothetical protein SKAU_G00304170 [Synaphobranchus kaupii]|uniref:Uncharacterized protein n=1 Tax=Synaphobranchus kaupii TaxID=118154 RepID=A0A9Q1EW87_SYNKA|nr:hypothetical protein SKAU_G00304170 [Synaphobranchus kaupii]
MPAPWLPLGGELESRPEVKGQPFIADYHPNGGSRPLSRAGEEEEGREALSWRRPTSRRAEGPVDQTHTAVARCEVTSCCRAGRQAGSFNHRECRCEGHSPAVPRGIVGRRSLSVSVGGAVAPLFLGYGINLSGRPASPPQPIQASVNM